MAAEYRWSSTTGERGEDGSLPQLAHCFIFEMTEYAGTGKTRDGYFLAAPTMLDSWRLRNPTDGRSGPVGLERFSAASGWAWDRHKIPGSICMPPENIDCEIVAVQKYRYHCEACGVEDDLLGPIRIVRRVIGPDSAGVWRYTLSKHGRSVWLEFDAEGYVGDSAGIGFGPDWIQHSPK